MNAAPSSLKTLEWSLLGPTSVGLALAVLLMKAGPVPTLMPFVAVFGLICAWKWKTYGACGAAAVLACLLAFEMASLSSSQGLWLVGLTVSIATGLFITAAAMIEVESELADQQPIEQEVDQEELQEANRLVQELHAELLSQHESNRHLQQEVERLQALKQPYVRELAPVERECRRFQGMLLQLREQFAQKSTELDNTRKLLFEAQERCEILGKEAEEAAFDRSEEIAGLEKYVLELEHEILLLEEETS